MSACIWYVSKYVHVAPPGSPSSRGFSIMREFARLGHTSVVVTSDSAGKGKIPRVQGATAIERIQGVTVCRLRTLQYVRSDSLRRVASWIDFERRLLLLRTRQLPKPDAIVVSSLSLLTVLNGLRLRRRFGCRLIFEVRDIWPLTLVDDGDRSKYNPFVLVLGFIERLGYKRADEIVGTMPNLSEHVEQVTGRPLRVHCIPMGVDPDDFRAEDQAPAEVLALIPAGKFVVAYAGSIGISNALETLFECASQLQKRQDVHFIVMGDGGLRSTYMERYSHLPNLTFIPAIPRTQVNSVLTRCNVLVLLTDSKQVYRFGQSMNKITDYMMSARPIIACYGGFRSMINEADCGSFIVPSDPDALEAELLRYQAQPAAALDQMGCRGRDWILAHRQYRELAAQYLAIIFRQNGQ